MPGYSKQTPAHQDNFYFNLAPCSVVTMWVAMDPVDEGNGCLRYLKQSLATKEHANGAVGLLPHNASLVKGFSQTLAEFSKACHLSAAVFWNVPHIHFASGSFGFQVCSPCKRHTTA